MTSDKDDNITDIRRSICSRMSNSRLSTARRNTEIAVTDFNTTKVSRRDSEVLRAQEEEQLAKILSDHNLFLNQITTSSTIDQPNGRKSKAFTGRKSVAPNQISGIEENSEDEEDPEKCSLSQKGSLRASQGSVPGVSVVGYQDNQDQFESTVSGRDVTENNNLDCYNPYDSDDQLAIDSIAESFREEEIANIKDWIRETFSHVPDKKNIYENPDYDEKTFTIRHLKRLSVNTFGKCFLCCAGLLCLKSAFGEEKVEDIAQRVTIATTSNFASGVPTSVVPSYQRKTHTGDLLGENLNNNPPQNSGNLKKTNSSVSFKTHARQKRAQSISVARGTSLRNSKLAGRNSKMTDNNSVVGVVNSKEEDMYEVNQNDLYDAEKVGIIVLKYHSDRLRKHLTYPNNLKMRGKPSILESFGFGTFGRQSSKWNNQKKEDANIQKAAKRLSTLNLSSPAAQTGQASNAGYSNPFASKHNKIDEKNIKELENEKDQVTGKRLTEDQIARRLIPDEVKTYFGETEHTVSMWSFNLIELKTQSPLKWMIFETLSRFDLLSHFRVPIDVLNNFCTEMEIGYQLFENQYHNNVHAADVLQTIHHMLIFPGLYHWLNNVEMFAILIAAAAHDLEHTGTTNNFHVKTRSDLATLYNDASCLENHHAATLFAYLNEPRTNICCNMSLADFNRFRSLVIEMILGTDMQQHFKQMTKMNDFLNNNTQLEKAFTMTVILHSADISNPAKPYDIHSQWTDMLLEEYFQQGDDEAAMGLDITPLCDRHTTRIPESQVGFIDFIVSPCYRTLNTLLRHVCDEVLSNYQSPKFDENEEDAEYDKQAEDEKTKNGIAGGSELKIISKENSHDTNPKESWADFRKMAAKQSSFEIVSIEKMSERVSEFQNRIENILETNKNTWKVIVDQNTQSAAEK